MAYEKPDLHVYPVSDIGPHDTGSRSCACNPKIETFSWGQAVVIHNSWDGREITERAVETAEQAVN